MQVVFFSVDFYLVLHDTVILNINLFSNYMWNTE